MSIINSLKGIFGGRKTPMDESVSIFDSASQAFDKAFEECAPLSSLAEMRSEGSDESEYTVRELDEYYQAMIALTEAFSPLLDAVSNFNGPKNIRASTEELLGVYSKMYALAAERYAAAAKSAMTTALKGSIGTTKMQIDLLTLKKGLEHRTTSSEEAAEAKHMEESVSDLSQYFSRLEARAAAAEAQAERFLSMARRASQVIR